MEREYASLFATALSALMLATGLVSIIAVGTGYYYFLLYSPFCLYSNGCVLEIFISLFASSSLVTLVLDAVFLYLVSSYLTGRKGGRLVVLHTLLGGLTGLFAEALWRSALGAMRVFLVGFSGGVASLAGASIALGGVYKKTYVSIGGSVREISLTPLHLAAAYSALRVMLSLAEFGQRVSGIGLGVLASLSLGYALQSLLAKSPGGPRGYQGAILASIALVALVAPVAAYLHTWASYRGASLVYVSQVCEVCYSVLKGAYQDCETFKTSQRTYLVPVETLEQETRELAGRGVALRCSNVVDATKEFDEYSLPRTLAIVLLLLTITLAPSLPHPLIRRPTTLEQGLQQQ